MMRSDMDRARALLANAAEVLVLTGAGMSAPSGVPTFRGPDGLWRTFRPEELATPEAFLRDARLVWEWYGWRRELVATCHPNSGHVALARWMHENDRVTLVTQNVDGLHEAAALGLGPDPDHGDRILRLHGSIFRIRCTDCHHEVEDRRSIDASSVETLPRCGSCDGLFRPAVVWFGESLPVRELRRASAAAQAAAVCLVIGTSGTVYPAAALAHEATQSGADLVVVDPGETAYDDLAEVRLVGSAADLIPELLRT